MPLKADLAAKWSRKNMPTVEFFSDPDLVPVLAYSLSTTEKDLYVLVRQQFQDKFSFVRTIVQYLVDASNLTESQFLSHYSTVGCHVDGLFIWLATIVTRLHLNFVHSNGI